MDRIVADAELAGACRSLSESGYCLIKNVLAPDRAEVLRERIVSQARAERTNGGEFAFSAEAFGDEANQWIHQLVNKGDEFRELPLHPVARALATHVLGKDHYLSALDSHITHPGNQPQQLHADQWWVPAPAVPGDKSVPVGDITRKTLVVDWPTRATHAINGPFVLNIMWMLTDFTLENGATRIVPGSHLSGGVPSGEPRDDEIQIEGTAGSLLAWEGRTWHGAGLNRADGPRVGMITFFSGPMVRTLSNYTLGLRSEVKAKLSDELLGLLGFAPWEGYGMTDDPNATVARSGDESVGQLHGP